MAVYALSFQRKATKIALSFSQLKLLCASSEEQQNIDKVLQLFKYINRLGE